MNYHYKKLDITIFMAQQKYRLSRLLIYLLNYYNKLIIYDMIHWDIVNILVESFRKVLLIRLKYSEYYDI